MSLSRTSRASPKQFFRVVFCDYEVTRTLSMPLLISRVTNWLAWTLLINVLKHQRQRAARVKLRWIMLDCWQNQLHRIRMHFHENTAKREKGTNKKANKHCSSIFQSHIINIIITIGSGFLYVRRCADTSMNLMNVLADKSNAMKINHFLIQHLYASCTNLLYCMQRHQSILISNRITSIARHIF